jgi:indolepyruvate ferredoxin oxidoreductase beta subunit
MNDFNMVLAGVGGQGILLAAEVVGSAAVKDGLNVRVSEIHGMAQRGGSVVSNVRIGEHVLASTVLDGDADLVLGFEQLETIRNLKSASEKTVVIMNTQRIPPVELAAKNRPYPSLEEIVAKITVFTHKIVLIEASELANQAGSTLTLNSVLLGASAATENFPVKPESLRKSLRELVPEKHIELNIKAFQLGYTFVMDKDGKRKT